MNAPFSGMPQVFPPFPLQIRAQNPIPMAPPLYVGDLDENIREEALYDLFSKFGQIYYIRLMRDPNTGKSRGFAYVNFCNPRDAEQAKLVAQHEKLGRKSIRIMYKRNIKGLNEANIFVKNIDKNATVKELHTFFSQVGTVVSAKLAVDQNGDSRGYGYVQFEKVEDAKTSLEKVNGQKFKEQNIEVVKFVPNTERGPRKRNNLYIKQLPDIDEEVLKTKIKEIFSQFGEIDQMVVKKDPKIGKSFSFVCFHEAESAAKAVEHFHANTQNPFGDSVPLYVNFSQTKQEREDELRKRRAEANNQNNLYMKNIKEDATKEKAAELFGQFGEVISCEIKKWDNPNNTKKVQYGFVAFKTIEDAQKALNGSHENEEIKKLFFENRPVINVFQNKEQRGKFLQAQHRNRFGGMPNFPPQFDRQMQQSMMGAGRGPFKPIFPPYGMPMPGGVAPGGNMGGQPRQFMGPQSSNKAPNRGPRPQGGRPFGPGQGQGQGPRPQGGRPGQDRPQRDQGQFRQNFAGQEGGRRPQQGGQGPAQQQFTQAPKQQPKEQTTAAGQPPASTITVADLKAKWGEFTKLDTEKQRNILGELLFPMIRDRVGETLAPKITGMLIDLDVLEISEIFEFLEDRDLLHERVEEAKQLILSEN